MNRLLPRLLGVALVMLQASERTLAAPLTTYGALPAFEEVAVSPKGDRIATVRTVEDARVVAISSLVDGKTLAILKVGEAKLRAVSWLDDAHMLIQTSVTGVPHGMEGMDSEWIQSQIYNVDTKSSRQIPSVDPDAYISGSLDKFRITINATVGRPMVRIVGGDTVLFLGVPEARVNQPVVLAIYRFDVTTGTQRVV